MSAGDTRRENLHADLLDLEPDAGETAAPSPGRREALLATLRPATLFEGFVDRLASFLDLAPARVRELARAVADVTRSEWVDDQVAGVRLLHFAGGPRHASADCGIVHLAPGTRYPRHLHIGDEWSLVLAGSAVEESTGRVWLPGDLVHNDAGTTHAFRAVSDTPFVFAVVLANGIRMEEPMPPTLGMP